LRQSELHEPESTVALELFTNQATIAAGEVARAGSAIVVARSLPGGIARCGIGVDGRVRDDQQTAGAQHTGELFERALEVERVMKGSGDDRGVDASRGERQGLQISAEAANPAILDKDLNLLTSEDFEVPKGQTDVVQIKVTAGTAGQSSASAHSKSSAAFAAKAAAAAKRR